MKLSSLSAFFPCFNEEANVELMVEQLQKVLPKLAKKYEIIIVNDGSRDNTSKIARKLQRQHKNVRIVNHLENRGYGASLRSGFDAAKYDWLFFTDGDLQFDVEQLEKFIQFSDRYDVIIGYRTNRAEGKLRAFNARLYKLYVDLLFRLNVKDIDCAFKLLRTKTIQSLNLESTGAFISSEFLYRLKKKGLKFKQLPVTHYPRQYGKPTGNNIRVIFKAGWEALKLYLHMRFGWFSSWEMGK
jgi:glycosyltransferase involved in cell wall biosynthesis